MDDKILREMAKSDNQKKYGHKLGNAIATMVILCIMMIILAITLKFIFWLF